jgi:hypothetical protein
VGVIAKTWHFSIEFTPIGFDIVRT